MKPFKPKSDEELANEYGQHNSQYVLAMLLGDYRTLREAYDELKKSQEVSLPIAERNWAERYAKGYVNAFDIYDEIAAWHERATAKDLHEFLGLEWEEYSEWVGAQTLEEEKAVLERAIQRIIGTAHA